MGPPIKPINACRVDNMQPSLDHTHTKTNIINSQPPNTITMSMSVTGRQHPTTYPLMAAAAAAAGLTPKSRGHSVILQARHTMMACD